MRRCIYIYIYIYIYIFTNLISTSIHGIRKKNRQEDIKVSRITARGKRKKYRSKRKKRLTSSATWKKSRDTQSVIKRKLKTFRESCNATITKVLNTSGANYKINLNRESKNLLLKFHLIGSSGRLTSKSRS